MTDTQHNALVERLTRPIIGIESRTAQEAFDIMADRVRLALRPVPLADEQMEERARRHLSNWGADSVGERGDALVRMLLAFAQPQQAGEGITTG